MILILQILEFVKPVSFFAEGKNITCE